MGKYFEKGPEKLLPLWAQTVIAFTIITIIVTFISGLAVRKSEEKNLYKELARQAEKTVALITAGAIDAVISKDIPVLETMVKGVVKSDPDISSLVVEDEEGRRLAGFKAAKEIKEDQVISFTKDVSLEGETFGKITVKFNSVPFWAEIERRVYRIRILLTAFLVLLALMVLLAVRYLIVLPIKKINLQLEAPDFSADDEKFSAGFRPSEFVRLNGLVASRLQMENELLKERDRSVQILMETPILVYGVNADNNTISFVNPAFEKCSGFKADEIVGQRWHEALRWRGLCGNEKDLYSFLTTRSSKHDFEDELITKKGKKCTILWHHLFRKNNKGKVDEIIGFGNDITTRKRNEAAIKEAKEDWERTFDSITDIVTIQDSEMRILRVNKAAAQYLQATPEDLVGKHCYEVFQKGSEQCVDCPERTTVADHLTHSAEVGFGNGKTFYVTSSPYFNRTGQFVGIVHTAKDITERKLLEAKLFQSQKMEAIGTLAGGIAHDFNNILTVVLGYTDLAMTETGKDPHMAEFLQGIHTSAIRAKELVSQILAFSRKKDIKYEPVDISVMVKETVKFLRASLPANIEIRNFISENPGNIMADPTQIHQVLMNLCSNAAYAMNERGGVLEIRLERLEKVEGEEAAGQNLKPGAYLKLIVHDTGTGIDKQIIDRIFEPFFTTKEKEKGTGMGLAAVHGIIQSHGGSIMVESESGQGTTFNIFFPVVEFQQQVDQAGVFKSPPTGNENILFVDDEESIVQMAQRMLEFLGYKVVIALSGEEALEKFVAEPAEFDLLVTDQTMPGMTGIELVRRILQKRPGLPVILSTGNTASVDEEKAAKAGVRGFMVKPFALQKLAEKIREALDGGRRDSLV